MENYNLRSVERFLITDINELIQNIRTMERHLTGGASDEKAEAKRLIRDGVCFVTYKMYNEYHFAPSRFLGYGNNNLERPIPGYRHGSRTNIAISGVLECECESSKELENRYLAYCRNIGIQPREKGTGGNSRRFWPLEQRLIFSTYVDLFEKAPTLKRESSAV